MRAVTGVDNPETAVRSVFEHLLPPGPGNLEKTTDFAARLARGSVFADNLRELAEDFRTETDASGDVSGFHARCARRSRRCSGAKPAF